MHSLQLIDVKMSLGRHWKVFAVVAIAILLSRNLSNAQEYADDTETTSTTVNIYLIHCLKRKDL